MAMVIIVLGQQLTTLVIFSLRSVPLAIFETGVLKYLAVFILPDGRPLFYSFIEAEL